MILSYFTLRQLTEKLQESLQKQRVQDAFTIPPHDLYLKVEAGEQRISGGSRYPLHLLLSASPHRGRIALSDPPSQEDRNRPSWVERYLLNAQIAAVRQVPLERIIELDLVKRDRLGGETRCRLISEVMGRYSNVVAVSEPGTRIVGTLRQVGGRMSRARQILPGRPYLPPPPQSRLRPDEVTPSRLREALEPQDIPRAEALLHTVAGLDLLTAREILWRAGIREDGQITSEEAGRILQELEALFENPPFLDDAVTVPRPKGRGREVLALDLQHLPGEGRRPFPSVSGAIEAVVLEEMDEKVLDGRKGEIKRALNRRLTAVETKIARIEADLEDAGRADLYEKNGTLLMSNLHRVRPGATSITLSDFFEPGTPDVTVPLDPGRPPAENAKDYLKKGKKARKGAPVLARRLEASRREGAELHAHLKRLEALSDEADLSAFQEEMERSGLIRPRRSKGTGQKGKSKGDAVHSRRYRTSDGWLVMVGRNNRENDRLTKQSAKDDLFFHAQGCPGSHVILKREGKPGAPPRTTLKQAAGLAAYWSKARGAKTVPVNYTEVRHVQKPRGASPGLVTIRNEKTLFVAPHEIRKADEE